MSIESLVIAAMHSRATGATKNVLMGIANHDGDGGSWPSIRTLMRWGSCNERNVQKALVRLQELGEIRVELQAGGSRELPDHRRPNRYHFLLECPFDCDRSKQHRTLQEKLFDRTSPPTPGVAGDTPPGVAGDTPPGVAGDTRTLRENHPRNPGVGSPVPQHARGAAVDNRPEHECDKGWLYGEDHDGRRVPCLVCKPHLMARR